MSLQLTDGSVFASRYRIVRRIAMGGMGAVYEAEHTETLRRLALKVMLPHIVQSAEMRDRFRREAQVAAHIESEHIVGVFDAGIDDATGMPFIVMELLRGEELAQALRRVRCFPPADVVTFLHQAALALEKTHRASIVHRDLKPENLFLTLREDGQPRIKVLDFGIAKLVAENATQDPSTRSLGTPLYMAPEQFRSTYPVSPATDIYALGMIAFTLLVGTSYWAEEAKDSSNIFVFAGSVMAGPRETASMRARRRGVPLSHAFDAWFARITALDPGQRFPSALAAVGALAQALGVAAPAGAGVGVAAGISGSISGMMPAAGFAPGAPPLPPAPGGEGDAAATLLYTGSGSTGPNGGTTPYPAPMLGASGPVHTGPSSTGSAYGATAGVPPRGLSTGKLLGAIVAAIVLAGVAVTAILVMRLPSDSGPTNAAGSASAAAVAAAPASAAPVAAAPASAAPAATPAPSATEKPAASAANPPVQASAHPSAAAQAAPVPSGGHTPVHKGPAPAPAETAKKSIFVRD